jgi:hypothetical protein
VWIVAAQLADHFPRTVAAAIVYQDNLIAKVVRIHHLADPSGQFGQGFYFVKNRYNYRDIH